MAPLFQSRTHNVLGVRQPHYIYDSRRTRPEDSPSNLQLEDPRLALSSSDVHSNSIYHGHHNVCPPDAVGDLLCRNHVPYQVIDGVSSLFQMASLFHPIT
jgi:hypothetical protein